MTALLLHLSDVDEALWADRFRKALPEVAVYRRGDGFDPADIDYIFVWKPQPDAFEGLSGLKAVFSLGAGVDALLRHPRLPRHLPLVRYADDELSQKMTDYVVANVSMHHRALSRFRADQRARRWTQYYPPQSSTTQVGIMGLGVLGQHAAERLGALGFSLRGWSRSPKTIAGMSCFAGWEAFDEFLSGTDILVCLLPLTEDTRGILNTKTFAKLRRDGLKDGPVIVNAARGGHQVEADIARALTEGTLAAASLDVFEVEPLPAESPLWDIETCYITPHIAAISDQESGARYFAQAIADHIAGRPLKNVVDLSRGY
jgi:glyoxylate/hydroxypyruvate reductase A